MLEGEKTVLEIHLNFQNPFRSYLNNRMLLSSHNLYGQSYQIIFHDIDR